LKQKSELIFEEVHLEYIKNCKNPPLFTPSVI
jgi:hypothetical protein